MNTTYIQDAVRGFENLYGEELTEQQRDNLTHACEYGETTQGIDSDLATEIILAWGNRTEDMDVALDNVEKLKTILCNFRGSYEDLSEYLDKTYLDEVGISDPELRSYAAIFTDDKKYQRSLEMHGWVFAPNSDCTSTYVFSA